MDKIKTVVEKGFTSKIYIPLFIVIIIVLMIIIITILLTKKELRRNRNEKN